MSISGIATGGLMSGINVNDLISQMVKLEQRPVNLLKLRKNDYEVKIATVLTLSTKLSSYKASISALNDSEKFNTKSATVSKTSGGTELLSVSASSEAVKGSYSVGVNQLATASKKASMGWVDQNSTAVNSAGGTFRFKVGSSGAETSISVGSTMTLEGLRNAINSENAGVTASIINDGTGSNPYRLILTADDTGSSNEIIITDNTTSQNLGFMDGSGSEPKMIEAAYASTDNSYSGGVYSNSGSYYTGTNNKTFLTKITTAGSPGTAKYKWSDDGGITWSSEVTTATLDNTASQYVITAGSNDKIIFNDGSERTATLTAGTYTADALATEIKTQMESANGSADTYTVTYDSATGKFSIKNDDANSNGITINWSDADSTASGILGYDTTDSTVAVGSTDTGDYVGGMFIDGAGVANSTNGGVKTVFGSTGTLALDDTFSVDVFNPTMQDAKDAVIEIDNATIVKSSNEITDAIQGVTLNLLEADSSSTLSLTVSSSSEDAKKSIEKFVKSYNDLNEFINEQLSYDPDNPEKKPLLGDPTLLEIRRKTGDLISGTVDGLNNESYTNLSQIGITSNYKTGKLSLDSSELNSALSSDPDAVARLFVGTATVTNQAITFESKTSDTQAGTYGVSISTAPEQATVTGDNDLSETTLQNDETLIIKYSTNYQAADKTFTAFSATLSAGSTINTIVTTLNSAFATNDAPFTASKTTDGKLQIKADEYGDDVWFKVTTDQGDATRQVWDASGSTEDYGVDIAGSINNHAAEGAGNVLTAASGFDEDGLKISTTTNTTGLFGTISVSRGIADLLPSILDTYVDSDTGILKSKETSMQDSIDDIDERIELMEKRIADKRERLAEEFTRLETVLAKYDTLSQYVTNTLANLPMMERK